MQTLIHNFEVFFNINLYFFLVSFFLTIPAIIVHFRFGHLFFYNGDFFEKCTIGLAINAIIVCLLTSFAAILVKYYLFLFYLVFTTLFILKKDFKKIYKDHILTILLIYFFLTVIFISNYNQIESVLFNAHQSYYSGIPIEILQADYFDRLKIRDNFPAEWPKFHFFNGSLEALVLFFQLKKNYLTFYISKLAIISLMISLFIFKINEKKLLDKIIIFIFVLLIIVIIMPAQLKWTLAASSYTSLFFLLYSLYYFSKKNYLISLVLISIFTISTSRSLVSGISILLLNLYFIYKNYYLKKLSFKINYSLLFFLIIFLGGLFSLVLVGKSSGEKLVSLYFGNFYNQNWLYLMSPAITNIDLENLVKSNLEYKQIFLYYFSFVGLSLYLAIKFQSNIFLENIKKYFLIILVILSAILILLFFYSTYFDKIIITLFYFCLPCFLSLIISGKEIFKFTLFFVVSSMVSVIIFPAGISIPNYILIEWIILFGFIKLFLENFRLNKPFLIFMFCLMFTNLVPMNLLNIFNLDKNDTSTKKIFFENYYPNTNLYCFKNNNNAAIASLMGQRVTYSLNKSKRYNVSERFVINKNDINYKALKICENE